MAYDYEKSKKLYESLSPDKQQEFAKDTSGNVQRFLSEYNAEKNKTSQINQTSTPATNNNVAKPEYQGTGGSTKDVSSNPYVNQGNGTYSYNAKSGYYEKQGSTTPSTPSTPETPKTDNTNSNYAKIRDAWDKLSYAEQQAKLKENPSLRQGVEKVGGTFKTEDTESTKDTGDTGFTGKTADGNWDYQDNSPERMAQMAYNVDQIYQSNPGIFANEDSFRNFFIDGKGRTPEQEKFLMDYYKNMKEYNKYDGYTSEAVGGMYAYGKVPEEYLNYVKNSNPQRYAEIMDAKDKEQAKIKNNSTYDSILEQNGFESSSNLEWQKKEGLLVDKNNDLIDDRLYHEPTEEERQKVDRINEIDSRMLEINNALKWAEEDLTAAYPGATKATIMALVNDRSQNLLREKDDLMVERTQLSGTVEYLQNERQQQDDAGKQTITNLQKGLGMYYDYSPEGMSELLNAQYEAANPSLASAENGTETDKRRALDSVLTGYFDKYGSIIERPKEQVINDVLAYAKKNGVTLEQALQENFVKYLKQKPGYNALATGQSSTENKYNWSSYEGPDGKKHILRMNETTGQWEELDIGDAISDMADLDGLQSKNRDTRKQALFNLAQQADNPQVQAELIAAAMEGNYAGTCGAYANDINYAITGDKNGIFGNDVKQKEGVCDNTEWDNIQAGDFVVFNYQQIPGVSRNVVPSWLGNTDLETWQDMYDHGHVGYVTGVDSQGNITMTHTKNQIAQTSTFGKNTKLGQALYGSYTPAGGYDKSIPDSIYKAVGAAAEKGDFDTLDKLAKKYNYSDSTALVRQYERQYQDSILPVAEGLLQKIDQLIASTQNTNKLERAATLKGEGSYVNSEAHAAYQSLLNDYALDKLSNMTVKLSPMSDTDVKIVASATTPFMNEGYMYANDNYFRDLQNIRDSIISRSTVLQKKYGDTNAWNGQKQYYDGTTQRFTSTKPRGVLGGN